MSATALAPLPPDGMRTTATRWAMSAILIVYLPHLADEALSGMCDDPIIATALSPFAALSPRHATYLMFQMTFAAALIVGFVATLGASGRRVVLGALALSLLCEGHHLVRAALTLQANSGLFTSLPMPILGAFLLQRVLRGTRTQRIPAASAD